ncbi:unnamed protein product [Adineta ricciae]|uniref:Uncharacterized protein n=1 Tax=Adineta ricciae TaxID=249248 RepID=A0A815W9B5_ADIRI|nr:unnamed protein product [Adineta ricciae]
MGKKFYVHKTVESYRHYRIDSAVRSTCFKLNESVRVIDVRAITEPKEGMTGTLPTLVYSNKKKSTGAYMQTSEVVDVTIVQLWPRLRRRKLPVRPEFATVPYSHLSESPSILNR